MPEAEGAALREHEAAASRCKARLLAAARENVKARDAHYAALVYLVGESERILDCMERVTPAHSAEAKRLGGSLMGLGAHVRDVLGTRGGEFDSAIWGAAFVKHDANAPGGSGFARWRRLAAELHLLGDDGGKDAA